MACNNQYFLNVMRPDQWLIVAPDIRSYFIFCQSCLIVLAFHTHISRLSKVPITELYSYILVADSDLRCGIGMFCAEQICNEIPKPISLRNSRLFVLCITLHICHLWFIHFYILDGCSIRRNPVALEQGLEEGLHFGGRCGCLQLRCPKTEDFIAGQFRSEEHTSEL